MSPTLQVLLSSPAVALTSVMACRVHRNLILEASNDSDGTVVVPLTALNFGDEQVVTLTLPTSADRSLFLQSESGNGQLGRNVSKGDA